MQNTCRSEKTCRLEDTVALSVGKHHTVDVLQRETPQIHLPGLTIGHRHSIVSYSRMLRSQTADRYGFQSADTAIVLYRHT